MALYKYVYDYDYYVRKIPRIGIGRPLLQRGVVLKWFIHRKPWEHLCRRYMRSTECPCSLYIHCVHKKHSQRIFNIILLGLMTFCIKLGGLFPECTQDTTAVAFPKKRV